MKIIFAQKMKSTETTSYWIKTDCGFYTLSLWSDSIRAALHNNTTLTLNYWDNKRPPNPSGRAHTRINLPIHVPINEDDIEQTINKIFSLAVLL